MRSIDGLNRQSLLTTPQAHPDQHEAKTSLTKAVQQAIAAVDSFGARQTAIQGALAAVESLSAETEVIPTSDEAQNVQPAPVQSNPLPHPAQITELMAKIGLPSEVLFTFQNNADALEQVLERYPGDHALWFREMQKIEVWYHALNFVESLEGPARETVGQAIADGGQIEDITAALASLSGVLEPDALATLQKDVVDFFTDSAVISATREANLPWPVVRAFRSGDEDSLEWAIQGLAPDARDSALQALTAIDIEARRAAAVFFTFDTQEQALLLANAPDRLPLQLQADLAQHLSESIAPPPPSVGGLNASVPSMETIQKLVSTLIDGNQSIVSNASQMHVDGYWANPSGYGEYLQNSGLTAEEQAYAFELMTTAELAAQYHGVVDGIEAQFGPELAEALRAGDETRIDEALAQFGPPSIHSPAHQAVAHAFRSLATTAGVQRMNLPPDIRALALQGNMTAVRDWAYQLPLDGTRQAMLDQLDELGRNAGLAGAVAFVSAEFRSALQTGDVTQVHDAFGPDATESFVFQVEDAMNWALNISNPAVIRRKDGEKRIDLGGHFANQELNVEPGTVFTVRDISGELFIHDGDLANGSDDTIVVLNPDQKWAVEATDHERIHRINQVDDDGNIVGTLILSHVEEVEINGERIRLNTEPEPFLTFDKALNYTAFVLSSKFPVLKPWVASALAIRAVEQDQLPLTDAIAQGLAGLAPFLTGKGTILSSVLPAAVRNLDELLDGDARTFIKNTFASFLSAEAVDLGVAEILSRPAFNELVDTIDGEFSLARLFDGYAAEISNQNELAGWMLRTVADGPPPDAAVPTFFRQAIGQLGNAGLPPELTSLLNLTVTIAEDNPEGVDIFQLARDSVPLVGPQFGVVDNAGQDQLIAIIDGIEAFSNNDSQELFTAIENIVGFQPIDPSTQTLLYNLGNALTPGKFADGEVPPEVLVPVRWPNDFILE